MLITSVAIVLVIKCDQIYYATKKLNGTEVQLISTVRFQINQSLICLIFLKKWMLKMRKLFRRCFEEF